MLTQNIEHVSSIYKTQVLILFSQVGSPDVQHPNIIHNAQNLWPLLSTS